MPGRELELILTHEHTDFDALASLLGASLLFPNALAVLPRQMNRNVREFVTLYRSHLPFVNADELPRARIRKVILVDTRALNAPRGLAPDAEVLVIDHHAAQPDESPDRPRGQRIAPLSWQFVSEPVGANATLLTEKLLESKVGLSPLYATLLALGIHEDTGSLTYGSTTNRDAIALGRLLEPDRGVNMDVLNQFLHHPLSAGQRRLLQDLIDHSEFLTIEGHNVVIAQATADRFGEEISTVAARLRDFHEPDAVFLVIDLHDMVQVVARSATDEIDVGAITRQLGGGGHARAAAAPVHGMDAEEVREEVIRLVRLTARAAITVRHIMSLGRPQVISPDIAINTAAELMRRYGHEGFPVVKKPNGNDELLGVLTRREADRAISHGLGNEAVRRFMRAGNVTIRPDDSIALLRRTMIDSGWGQIPVVDEDGTIIGIVTRTDLIKLWDDTSIHERGASEIEKRISSTLSPVGQGLLRLIGREVDEMGYTVYAVGGFPRDLLVGDVGPQTLEFDLDIVIEGDAIAFAHRMADRFGGRVVQHRQFGTAKWLLGDGVNPVDLDRLYGAMGLAKGTDELPQHLDFVTARTEFYTAPSVLPTVESSSIKLDLHRRDFTINTLALCLNPNHWGQLLDFYGGLTDLRTGVVRVLHSLSFVDDPTRILRAVRYEQRYGFEIEPRTLELLTDALEMLDRVTPARIRHELERILQESQPEVALARLEELGVLRQFHPDLAAGDWTAKAFDVLRNAWRDPTPDPDLVAHPLERLYWAALVYQLPIETVGLLNERLGLRRETQRLTLGVQWLRRNEEILGNPNARPSEIVAVLDEAEPSAIALFDVLAANPTIHGAIERYRTEWVKVHAELNGNDLRELGIPRGPLYRNILSAVRWARLDGTAGSRNEEVEIARRVAADAGALHVVRNVTP